MTEAATDQAAVEPAVRTVETPEGPIPERRRVPRLKCLLTGILAFDDRTSTMDCTVRNISAWGARVVLPDAFRLPEAFNLVVPHHSQTHRAEVIWRKGDNAGLALSDAEEHEARHKSTPREAAFERRRAMLSAIY